jgi:hypothetical protein
MVTSVTTNMCGTLIPEGSAHTSERPAFSTLSRPRQAAMSWFEPPISAGRSFCLGRPSSMCSTVS